MADRPAMMAGVGDQPPKIPRCEATSGSGKQCDRDGLFWGIQEKLCWPHTVELKLEGDKNPDTGDKLDPNHYLITQIPEKHCPTCGGSGYVADTK